MCLRRELIKEGFQRLPHARHEVLYEGYGFDDYVVESMFNFNEEDAEKFPLACLNNKSLLYKKFAEEFLHMILLEIMNLRKNSIDQYWPPLKELFSMSINVPPVETSNPSFSHNPELEALFSEYLDWIK